MRYSLNQRKKARKKKNTVVNKIGKNKESFFWRVKRKKRRVRLKSLLEKISHYKIFKMIQQIQVKKFFKQEIYQI